MVYDQQETAVKDGLIRDTNIIFIVEDDTSNGSLFTELISQETPYYALLLSNGFQALKLTQFIKPRLFLLDYYLPDMSGVELYDRLHARKELQGIPAIIVSACLEEHADKIEKRGLVAICKPFDLDEFLATIKKVLAQAPEQQAWYQQVS